MVFAVIFLVEKFVYLCLRDPLVFTDFSVALLTTPKAFLAALGNAVAHLICCQHVVLKPEVSHLKFTEDPDPSFTL